MPGLSPDLRKELQDVLLACGPFGSNDELRRVFSDDRLYPWRDQVPEAASRQGRVEAVLAFLPQKYHERYGNALLAFLEVSQARLDPEDGGHQQLAGLAKKWAQALDQGTPGREPDPARRFGRYELQETVGRGSFAVVYKARDTALNRPVALKVLHPIWQDDARFVARFKLEAQTMANLRHRHIVRVFDSGQSADGQLYIAMEYLPGRTLRAYLQEQGALALPQALAILQQIGAALDYAHGRGMVHRDLKPANVMVEETAAGLEAMLTDFGLVKAMEGSVALTIQASALGTPEYMAPEQADPNRPESVGPAADRYALGVLAYKLLTGRVPFPGNSSATIYAHEHKPPPAPRRLRPDLPETVEQALLQMLAKAPGERFASCAAFVAALAGPRPPTVEEQLADLYAGLEQAVAAANWFEVLLLGGQIRGLQPDYRAVNRHIAQAQAALARPKPMPPAADKPKAIPAAKVAGPERADVWVNPITGKAMVRIPAGPFLFGEKKEPRELPEYWIDKTPVTNAEYARFMGATGRKAPLLWNDGMPADHPVVWVSYEDAEAYAAWARGYLPDEAAWEKAARGSDGREYPWGNEWREGACNVKGVGPGETTPVGQYSPAGDSPYGGVDMSGNVWEWTSTKESGWYVFKGGSCYSEKSAARAAARVRYHFSVLRRYFGFRVCVAAPFDDAQFDSGDLNRNVEQTQATPTRPGTQQPTAGETEVTRQVADLAEHDARTADVWVNPITGKEMVRIPAGPFLFGEKKEQRELPEYWIDKTPVTNAEYARFMAATRRKAPGYWEDGKMPAGRADHPVVYVSFSDAQAYAAWARGYLPDEAAWEKAARGSDGREYPWGNEWQEGVCNVKGGGPGKTAPVGQYSPAGDSPYGCVDMSGNVWELTSTEAGSGLHIIKGGAYFQDKSYARAAARSLDGDPWLNYGFRVCVAAPFS